MHFSYNRTGKGRKSKEETKLIGQINSYLDGLSEKDRYNHPLNNRTISGKTELKEAWESIVLERKMEPPVEEKPIEPQQQEINYDNTMSDNIEDAKIEDESYDSDVKSSDAYNPNAAPTKHRDYADDHFDKLNYGEEIAAPEYSEESSFSQLDALEGAGETPQEQETKQQTHSQQLQDQLKTDDDTKYDNVRSEDDKPDRGDVTNKHLNDLPPKEKRMAAEQLVDTVLATYEQLHPIGANFAKMSEDKITKLRKQGVLDPDLAVTVDEDGTTATPLEFIQQMNADIDDALEYDPNFNDQVRAPMIRVAMKKGWGMTDEQYILAAFGKDIALKVSMVVGLKKQNSSMMKMFKEMHAEKLQALRNVKSVSPDSITKEAPQPQPEPVVVQDTEEVEEAEYTEHPIVD